MSDARAIAKDIPDFKNELSEIEIIMNSIGVEDAFAPKGHCEIVGSGIDHVWVISKVHFRKENAALTNEQQAVDLKNRLRLVLESMPIETIGKCVQRVPEYKLSHLSLFSNANDINKDCTLRLCIIDKMEKETKGKRYVLDQETSVIKNMVSLLE